MMPNPSAFRRACMGVPLVLLWLPGLLEAQQTSSSPSDTELRGELVRFADATIDVSVFARRLDAVPESLWRRIESAGKVSFLGQGSAEANERVHRRLEAIEGLRIEDVSDAADLPPVGVQIQEGDEIRLVWYHLTEDHGVAILADARAAYEPFALRILIPDPAVTQDDWWGLQAAVSKAGIRRVQIVSGRP